MDLELLKEIGLTDSEIKVYVALLELGSSSKGPIVDKSGVASSKIYELLDKLIQKGLVSTVTKSGVKYFESAPPKRLLDYMGEKKKDIEEKEKKLESLIPQLEVKRSLAGMGSETQVFKGIKGATTAFDDILQSCNKGDEIQILGFTDVSEEFQNFLIRFHNKRADKGIKLRSIFGEKVIGMINEFRKMPLTQVKVSTGDQDRPVAFLIYKDKVLFSMPTDDVWIQVKSKRLNDSFKTYFEEQWGKETYIVKGIDAVQDRFEEILETGQCDFIGARGFFVDVRPKFIDDWEKRAEKSGFKMRNIVDLEVKGHRVTTFPFAETKYTISKEFATLTGFWIYKNKVAITNWSGKEPITIVIENKQIVEMYKKQFELLWGK